MKLSAYFWGALLVACLAQGAQAASCDMAARRLATMDGVNRAKLLQGGNFAKLDKEMDALMQQTGKSGRTDADMLGDLMMVHQLSGREIKLLRAWASDQPQSFLAQLALGIAYTESAGFYRGQGSAANTSRNQLDNMKKLYQSADEPLQKALQLNPKSALPYTGFMAAAAMGASTGTTVQAYLQAANKADPKNLAARLTAMAYLSPRWGGSFELVDEVVKQAQSALPADQFKYLQYRAVMEKASDFEVIEKKPREANALYAQAKAMCDNAEAARDGWGRTLP